MPTLLTECVCGYPLSTPDEVSQHEQAWSQCKGRTAACPCRSPNCAHGKDCPYPGCSKSFRDNGTNKIHFLTHLPEAVRPKVSCSICSAEYKYPKDLKSHQRKKHGMLVPSQENAGTATQGPSLTLEPFQAEPGQGEDTSWARLVQNEIEGGPRSEDVLDAVRSFAATPQQPWTSQVNMPSDVQPVLTPDATFAHIGSEEPIYVGTSTCHGVSTHGDEPHRPMPMSHNAYDTYASDMMYPEYGLASQNEPLSAFVPAVDHTDIPGVETSVSHSYEAMGNFLNQGHKRVAEDTLDGGRENTLFIDDIEEPAVTFQLNWTIEEQQKYNLIVQSLDFVERETRLATIHEPSEGTSNWISESTAESKHEFPKWLRSDNGVFLILGKAGSGKSTLLKHIVHHEDCESLLSQWATVDGLEHELVTATCCFWRAGSDLQKKKEGLYRSLLTQILEQRRDLTPIALPKHWARQYHRDVEAERQSLDFKELRRALFRTVEHNILLRFCFFIDGLDEYSDTYALRDLVRDLEKLSDLINVKICITSRPAVIHDRYFEKRPRLNVEEFTKRDILHYIELKLEADERFEQLRSRNRTQAAEIIDEIQYRSEGVFLWVYLVIERLITDLEYMGTLIELQAAVKLLPPGMENLLDDIMERIEPDDRMYMARLLLLLVGPGRAAIGWAYCLVEEPQNPPSVFDINAGAFSYDDDDNDAEDMSEYSILAEIRVKRWCQDLIATGENSFADYSTVVEKAIALAVGDIRYVGFAHRTVFDYVEKHHQVLAQRGGSSFDVPRTRCRLSLLWLRKCLQAERIYNRALGQRTRFTSKVVTDILFHAVRLNESLEEGDQTLSVVLHSLNRMLTSCSDVGPLWPFDFVPGTMDFPCLALGLQSRNPWILVLSAEFRFANFFHQEITRLSLQFPELCAQICPYLLLTALRSYRYPLWQMSFPTARNIIKSLLNHMSINMSTKMRFRERLVFGDENRALSDEIKELTLWDELWDMLCMTDHWDHEFADGKYEEWKSGLFIILKLFFDVGAFDQKPTDAASEIVQDDVEQPLAETNINQESACSKPSERVFQDLLGMLADLNLDTTVLQDQWNRRVIPQSTAVSDYTLSSSETSEFSAASGSDDGIDEDDVQ